MKGPHEVEMTACGGAHLEGDAARGADQMLPPAYRARVSNIDHRRSKKNPVRNGVPDGASRVVASHHDAQEAPSGPYHRLRRMTVRSRTLDIRHRWIKTRRA